MPYEKISGHDVEYEAIQIPGTEQWAAYLAIFGPSSNPMHRNSIFPHQHVCVDATFLTREAAEAAALAAAQALLKPNTSPT